MQKKNREGGGPARSRGGLVAPLHESGDLGYAVPVRILPSPWTKRARSALVTAALGAALAACAAGSPAPLSRATGAPPAPSAAPARPPAPIPEAPSREGPDDAVVASLGEEYLALLVETSPESATALGLHARDADLDPRDAPTFDADTARLGALLARVEAQTAEARASGGARLRLGRAARTDLALLRGMLRTELLGRARRPLEREPQLYTSPMGAIFAMTAREYAPAPRRAADVVARLEKIPAVLAAARVNLGAPPAVWVQVTLERSERAKSFFEAQRPFLERHLPGELPRVRRALEGAARAYADYALFLKKTVLPRATGSFAAGAEHFTALLREGHFLRESPAELEAMGRGVLAETEAHMGEIAKRLDPHAKGWPEVVAKVKANHPKRDELLSAYRLEVARARDFLVKRDAVPFPEGDDLAVVDTPVFMRTTVIAAYDRPPPFDGAASTKGFFFVTPVDASLPSARQEAMLRENDHGDIVDTAVHEAYPGHHLQLSFAAKHPSKVRKVHDAPIFSEGWALYSEELMAELGYYTDEERLMQLEWTLVRAARVVLDVGLHTAGMTFDQATAFLTDRVHLERPLAVSEVKRYSMSPTQPLAYLTGRQGILALRARAKARDGAAFSLKAFHRDLLTRGTLPPGLLAAEIFGD